MTTLAELEREAILNTIRKLNGDKLLAAKLLGIGKTTLYRKLKEYGIDDPMQAGVPDGPSHPIPKSPIERFPGGPDRLQRQPAGISSKRESRGLFSGSAK